ncbi:hypothetical protein ACFLW8_06415 [Chloroflexota bacterium]
MIGFKRQQAIIIVDEGIDPSNISQVLWALGTRCDPAEHINIVRGFKAFWSDAIVSPEKRSINDYTTSKAIIYACRPYYWKEQFPISIKSGPEVLEDSFWRRTLIDLG